jgi:glucose-6-phosphate 1-dehydrogenase
MKNIDTPLASEIVIFGALGDLSRRKLLPSLYQLELAGLLSDDTRIIAVARNDLALDAFTKQIDESLNEFISEALDAETVTKFLARLVYQQLDFKDIKAYENLAKTLSSVEGARVYYYSTPPAIFGDISEGLKSAKLIDNADRVVMEKPIGHCLESSKVINDQVSRYFKEKQIYRIDHYLGKETVLNLLVLRFANSLFTNNWDRNCIDHVQITVAESVGIEGRWGFYDEAGQMRDMVQNHLLQVLSLLAMEPPADLSADSIRDEKLKVIKALKPITLQNVKEKTVRGQYADGYLNGVAVPGYLNEEGAKANSSTETFVAIKAEIDNWRWAGVPLYISSNKLITFLMKAMPNYHQIN